MWKGFLMHTLITPPESVLESSEEGFYIKDRCLLIFLTISECVQTIPSSCRTYFISVVYLKRGVSMISFSGLQTLICHQQLYWSQCGAYHCYTLTWCLWTLLLLCQRNQPWLVFDFTPIGRTYSHLPGMFPQSNTQAEMQEGTWTMPSRTRMFCLSAWRKMSPRKPNIPCLTIK